MSVPNRKPVVIAEATQELQAADVLKVLGSLGQPSPGAPGSKSLRASLTSRSSIAPVGLDLAQGTDLGDDDDPAGSLTGSVIAPLPERRRRLGKIVVGAVLGCGVILIAAGIARIGHASSEPAAATATATGQAATTTAAGAPSPMVGATAAIPSPRPVVAAATPAPAIIPGSASAGTVRLSRPTMAGHVWLDGTKISGTSAIVSCGTHQLKVGHGRKHSIDVPCGGEIAVTR